MSLNGEFLQTPLLLGGTLLAFPQGTARTSRATALAAGLCFGVAMGIRHTVLLHALLALGALFSEPNDRRARGALFFAGLAIPAIAILAKLSADGTLKSAWYYTMTFNTVVHVGSVNTSRALRPLAEISRAMALFVSATIVGALLWVRSIVRNRAQPRFVVTDASAYVGAHFWISLAMGFALKRFFPHYFIPTDLYVAVWYAGLLAPLLERCEAWVACSAKHVSIACGACLLYLAYAETYFVEAVDGLLAHGPHVKEMAKFLEKNSAPDDKMFVWGFSPWLYGYAHRRPAGRYLFSTYPSGVVPWFWDKPEVEARNVVPGSREALIDDLEREKPALIVDAGTVWIGRSMRTWPILSEWLHAHYCFVLRMEGYDVYRRRETECEQPAFPKPDRTYDYYGHAIGVPVPLTADDASSPWLVGAPGVPQLFPGAKVPSGVDGLMNKGERMEGYRLEALPPPLEGVGP
jgi:hypothetical protein